ncbi:MAG: hypothetical protein H0U66_02515 [Gemmatimonadaceae bacterium]|nr:hypothetical protein [Gemmatimonadaceae bacterium]
MKHIVARNVGVVTISIFAAVFCAKAQQGRSYRDPAGHFSISIPQGFTANAANGGVVVSRGTVIAMISPFGGVQSSREVVQQLARQYGSQWKDLQQIAAGDYLLNGAPASYGMYTGVSPKGVASLLRLVGVMGGGQPYAVIISSPKAEFTSVGPTLQGMEGSIAFAGSNGQGMQPYQGQQGPQQQQYPQQQYPQQQYPQQQYPQQQYPQQQDPQQQYPQQQYPQQQDPQQQYPQQQYPQQQYPQQQNPPSQQQNMRTARVPGAASAPGNFYRMHWLRLMDQYGFGQPVEVLRLLAPVGWKMDGGVKWAASGCTSNIASLSMRVVSPDGTMAFELFTPYTWQWNDDPFAQQTGRQAEQMNAAIRPCSMRPIVNAQTYLRQAVIPIYRRGARFEQGMPMPQAAHVQDVRLRQQLAEQIQAGLASGTKADAGRVLIAYEVNGKPVEESLTAVVGMIVRQTMSPSAAMQGGMGKVNSYTLTAGSMFGMRTPAGEQERRASLFSTMIASIRPNVNWVNAYQQMQMNIGNAEQIEVAKRIAINNETNHAVSAIITQQYQETQRVQDRLADSFSQSQRGVEHFVDPSSRERVELSAGYRQAWSNGNGEYILSDDVNFDPSVSLHENWTQLNRTQ